MDEDKMKNGVDCGAVSEISLYMLKNAEHDITQYHIRNMWNQAYECAAPAMLLYVLDNKFNQKRTIEMRFSLINTNRLHELLQIEKMVGGLQQLKADEYMSKAKD